MIPTWIIEEMERERRERDREWRDRPQLHIEQPVGEDHGPQPAPAPAAPVVIEVGRADAETIRL
jgi:hypothetical protein